MIDCTTEDMRSLQAGCAYLVHSLKKNRTVIDYTTYNEYNESHYSGDH